MRVDQLFFFLFFSFYPSLNLLQVTYSTNLLLLIQIYFIWLFFILCFSGTCITNFVLCSVFTRRCLPLNNFHNFFKKSPKNKKKRKEKKEQVWGLKLLELSQGKLFCSKMGVKRGVQMQIITFKLNFPPHFFFGQIHKEFDFDLKQYSWQRIPRPAVRQLPI